MISCLLLCIISYTGVISFYIQIPQPDANIPPVHPHWLGVYVDSRSPGSSPVHQPVQTGIYTVHRHRHLTRFIFLSFCQISSGGVITSFPS